MGRVEFDETMSTGREQSSRRFRRRNCQQTGQMSGGRAVVDEAIPGHETRPPGARGQDVLAALDLSNQQLQVADRASDPRRVPGGRRLSRIVRLGQGITFTGALSDEAMDRTVDALKICADKMRRRDVTLSRVVATASPAGRNGAAFIDRVKVETGLSPKSSRTARKRSWRLPDACRCSIRRFRCHRLRYRAAPSSPDPARPGRQQAFLDVMSMPIGVVTLTEKYGGDHFMTGPIGR